MVSSGVGDDCKDFLLNAIAFSLLPDFLNAMKGQFISLYSEIFIGAGVVSVETLTVEEFELHIQL